MPEEGLLLVNWGSASCRADYRLDISKNMNGIVNIDVDYMPAHIVQTRFPHTAEALACYDAIVISDIGSNTFLLQ
ncbi:glutamine amidotransferase, partial [Salmonella enterica subsp. enterica serovar Virginia]|nr:glutamine amidotransferase [Salmonella enterica subsp. enterica serovar Virginia]